MITFYELDVLVFMSITLKSILYFCVFKGFGTALSLQIFIRQLNDFTPELRRSAILFSALALVASVLSFSLQGAGLSGDISGMIDPEMLGILWQTPVGSVLLLRLIGLVLLLICLLRGGRAMQVGLLAGFLVLWSFTEIGHVLSSDLWWLKIVLFIHLMAGCFWIGILYPLALLLRDERQLELAAELGEQFGKMATIIVPVLILAGIVLTYILVGSVDNMLTSSYGLALLTKVIFVGVLLIFAAANKLRFVPGLRDGEQMAARKLSRSIRLEWIAIVGILVTTAVFTSVFAPPN